ncbi:MAG: tRNA glutamyl-Q(34) synthetase GluQRS [Pseudotabrizicola sp.]|uniref:tRNA glutamyl-Q(34) synthetase GluQRS n=1 Tax=Pseudotabrizicola sp. TaxID=2939647 RepID=UPI00273040F5|nr:tRNA glutamyl-Q(34) synthetase GluQRS [Pseudotabrizicola sp.]MDP2079823.1 tRNA glutamyl-Q(34) synthetase GluQRS [Pseudotabrizicola sp.]MDZ7574824.1 tRNA glutamyl-Q(34) synthetase GluQRS [Pseudotabrizicola sp.]
MAVVTRFAPSPTGPLHLGHAYSALLAHDMARRHNGTFLLRVEDIDQQRSKPEWEAQLLDDLHWLGICWDAPPMRQSDRLRAYHAALDRLWQAGYLYPCTCTRRDIETALAAPQEGAPHHGPDGPVYPGTCRPQHAPQVPRPTDQHLRLNIANTHALLGEGLTFSETGPTHPASTITTAEDYTRRIGDVVLARKDFGTSYHLSVVVDDAAQGITHVSRGEDLFYATAIHILLQRLLGLPTPLYHHHRLIRDDQGKRLAKRDDARALSRYRAEGATPQDIRRMVGL